RLPTPQDRRQLGRLTRTELLDRSGGAPARAPRRFDSLQDEHGVKIRPPPAGVNDSPGPDGHPCDDLGIACTNPWWPAP
ncbi:hypothetical protein, partial [Glycomyces salinus]|uniref:hypothetical protein n=1 Tax=Glycomyces salinus TaxID=980294 RepID=UPI001E31A374